MFCLVAIDFNLFASFRMIGDLPVGSLMKLMGVGGDVSAKNDVTLEEIS